MRLQVPDRIPGRITVVLVAVIALVATGLLVRAERNAAAIRDKTSNIAVSAQGINDYTDSIRALERTNEMAAAVGAALKPLRGPVGDIDERAAQIAAVLAAIGTHAQSIDTSSSSIDRSSGAIRRGLGTINVEADAIRTRVSGLNADAVRILADLGLIERGLGLINADLPTAARILAGILAEAGDILATLSRTEQLTGCIDRGLNGTSRCPLRGGS